MLANGVRWFLEEVLENGGPSRCYRVTYKDYKDQRSLVVSRR